MHAVQLIPAGFFAGFLNIEKEKTHKVIPCVPTQIDVICLYIIITETGIHIQDCAKVLAPYILALILF